MIMFRNDWIFGALPYCCNIINNSFQHHQIKNYFEIKHVYMTVGYLIQGFMFK